MTDTDPPEPSHPEAARTVVSRNGRGTLSTLDRQSGHPFGSVVEYTPLEGGDVGLLTSNLAEHTKNVREDERVSLLIAEGFGHSSLLAEPRVTLVGDFDDDVDDEALREPYLERHPGAERYVDFEDFAFARISVERVRYIGGFGDMSWVQVEAYRRAEPDPVAIEAEGILEHVNDDHPDAVADIARAFGGDGPVEEAEMVAVDRYGCELRWRADGDRQTTRVGFPERLEAAEETRAAMVELTERAREKLPSDS